MLLKSGVLFLGLALLFLAGCGDDKGSNPNNNPDLTDFVLSFDGMAPHVNQLMHLRIIDDQDQLMGYMVLNPLELADESFIMPDALPDEGSYHLDFFADVNDNGLYDAPPDDHAWRIDIPGSGDLAFSHNTNFTDIADPAYSTDGNRLTINFSNYNEQVGQSFELRVMVANTSRTLGLYRIDAIPASAFSISIPDIIENGVQYQIDFYADRNDNGHYDIPPEDQAWRVMSTGTATGIQFGYSHNVNFTDIEF